MSERTMSHSEWIAYQCARLGHPALWFSCIRGNTSRCVCGSVVRRDR